MKKITGIITCGLIFLSLAAAHNSYTGNYSGAPGKSSCASSCHGSSGGSITISGFPSSYIPGQTYTITISHTGGNKIINVNATTRLGSTTTVAGSFLAVSNSALYTGADGGIYVPVHLVDQVVFQWIAPAAGSGSVTLYAAGFQGTSTGSSSGQNTKLSFLASENTSDVEYNLEQPRKVELLQNYPNPFNPSTTIVFQVPPSPLSEKGLQGGFVSLRVYNVQGKEVKNLINQPLSAGQHEVVWNASGFSSGLYFARLESGGQVHVQKLVLTK